LLRVLWRTRGGFKISMPFRQEYDSSQFSEWLSSNFTADFNFEIDHDGNWNADFSVNFIHDESSLWQGNIRKDLDLSKPLSRAKSFALRGLDESTQTEHDQWIKYQEYSKMDLSFSDNFKSSGKWDDTVIATPKKTYEFIKIHTDE